MKLTVAIRIIIADLMVLAINALQVAMAKKYIADAVTSANGGFFASVEADRSNV
jgi:hypothetical protein